MSGSIRTSISVKELYDIVHLLLENHRWSECCTVQDKTLAKVLYLQGKIRHAEEIYFKNHLKKGIKHAIR